MLRTRLILIFIGMIIVSLMGTKFGLEDNLSSKGVDLKELTIQIDALKTENAYLKAEILLRTSYTYLNELARTSGFTDGVYYILKR